MKTKKAVIIGAGPGGLTAAYELLSRSSVLPIIFEQTDYIGGISRTASFKGNKIDIGGHRFFSKSDRVMEWWLNILPLQKTNIGEAKITYQNKSRHLRTSLDKGADPETVDRVMLLRDRKSRIYFNSKFFDYPISLSASTLKKLGFKKILKIGITYSKAALFPSKNPKNLEEFYINKFGTELYETFFKSYTEKVWGKTCLEISPEWGSQRVKGLSVATAGWHFIKKNFLPKAFTNGKVETSLIEQFLYPKLGPGQLWEEVAKDISAKGAEVQVEHEIVKINASDNCITSLVVLDKKSGLEKTIEGDYFFSTMPVKDLIARLDSDDTPPEVSFTSGKLEYRDFITVGLLLKKMIVSEPDGSPIKDNWIYIQEPGVSLGRVQIFNNWSPYLVKDPATIWVGLEYFCTEGDALWNLNDEEMINLGILEMEKIGMIHTADVIDATVIRMKKTYPGYFGEYKNFDKVREYIDKFENLFLIGRNGMHKYNNQDHSMLTAMTAVDNIISGRTDKANIWDINTEQEYHEESK